MKPSARCFRDIRRGPLLVILASSLAWALCYPPFPLGPVAFVVLAPLFVATAALDGRRAFWYNFAGGIAYNTVMYWWIYNVVKVGPALVIALGLVVLILFLSLFNGLLGWLFRFLAGRRYGLLAFPFLWAGLEVARTRGDMSFPWNNLGYALGHWPSLIQAASFLGTFGLSLAMVACSCLAYAAWTRTGRARLLLAAAAAGIPLLMAAQGSLSLAVPEPKDPRTLDITLVQPSIPQTDKWDERYFQEVMEKTWSTMERGAGADPPTLAGSALVVLPETAIPDFLRSRGDVYERFRRLARENRTDILVGALDFVPDDKPYRAHRFYNSAFLFAGSGGDGAAPGDSVRQYSKLRLVPFSERLPFDDVFPIINYVNLGEGDFSPGEDFAIWNRQGVDYAPSICYEIIYPEFVRGAKRRGASLLVNITNDGWFGRSNAPYQHANITRFRAIETGMPIARCSNAGISVFYDYKGRVVGKTRLFEQTVLRRRLPLTSRDTWYYRHGDAVEAALGWGFGLGLAVCLGAAWKRRKPGAPVAEAVGQARTAP
jgi:apolipoprotein N-acyltransferase